MTIRRRLATLAAVIMFVATVSAAQPAGAAVVIKGVRTTSGYRWKPHAVSVAVGTKVVWKAVTGTHTVTAYKGKWKKDVTIAPGQTTSFLFKTAGVYKFRCVFHSTLVNRRCTGMCGKAVVE
jgi:plastocyanin